MTSLWHNRTAWSLIFILTTIASVNEGLHFVPGFGHAVVEGDRLFLLGITLPNGDKPASSGARVAKENSLDIPILDEGECPICSAAGKRSLSGDSIPCDSRAPLVGEESIHSPIQTIAAVTRDSLPRAPPRS